MKINPHELTSTQELGPGSELFAVAYSPVQGLLIGDRVVMRDYRTTNVLVRISDHTVHPICTESEYVLVVLAHRVSE